MRFVIVTIWIVMTRAYDAFSTYQFTPDLSQEVNPLVTVLGMSWAPLLLTLTLLSMYAIYAYYISVFKPKDLFPEEGGYTKGEVLAYAYLGHKDHWTAIFYKFPKSIKRFNQYMGHTLTPCLVFVGWVSTLMWFGIKYTKFYGDVHSPALIYSIIIIGCTWIGYRWAGDLYKQYLASQLAN